MTSVGARVPGGRASAPRGHTRAKWTLDRVSFMAVFLVIPLAIFVVFVISPFVQAIYYSLTNWTGFSPNMKFIGLKNYSELLHDSAFLRAVLNIVELGVIVPLVTIAIALVIASVLTVAGSTRGHVRGVSGAGFYRAVSFFPYCIPAIVIGIIWEQVYSPGNGILNGFLTSIGLSHFASFAWLGEVSTAMPASMFVIIWAFIGFYTVLFVASIKGIPAEVYEAARLDGSGRFRTLASVTIPLILDSIQTAYIYLGIVALDSFVYMSALFPNAGGPNNTTLTITQDLFNTAFAQSQFGYATAMGVVLAIVTLLFAGLVFSVVSIAKRRKGVRA